MATKLDETLCPEGPFCSFIDFKTSMRCCAAVQLPVGNYKHPNFKWRGERSGGGYGLFCSLKLPYLSTNKVTS